MRVVYKFKVQREHLAGAPMLLPDGAMLLKLAPQYGNDVDSLYLWADCDSEAPLVPRQFVFFGTGHPIAHAADTVLVFVATVLLHNDGLVLHCYEVTQRAHA